MNFLLNKMTHAAEEVAKSGAGMLKDVFQESSNFREQMESDNRIHPVKPLSETCVRSTSLCAVDGASASKQMQSADLVAVGAVLANGGKSQPAPVEGAFGYMDVLLHSGDVASIVSAMRAMTEIAVLGTSDHDIVVIDGAMLNNYLSVILTARGSRNAAQPILDFLADQEQADAFYKGVRRIFSAKDGQSGKYHAPDGTEEKMPRIIALAKSDTSSTMVRTYLGRERAAKLKDKLVASTVLKPGEMLTPVKLRNSALTPDLLESNGATTLEDWDIPGFTNWPLTSLELDEKDRIFRMLNRGYSFDQVQAEPDRSVFNQYTYLVKEGHLFFTYYKPSLFTMGEQALRLEFSLPWDEDNEMEVCQEIITHLEADIVPGTKEPFCQFMVDRYAKEAISSMMIELEIRIGSQLAMAGVDASSALGSYRT